MRSPSRHAGAVAGGATAGIYLVMVVQSLMASGTHIVAKVVVQTVEPFTLTLLRSTIAALALAFVLIMRGRGISIRRVDYLKVVLLGLLAVPVNQFLFLMGLRHTTPSNAALLYATTPILVLLFSRWFRGEPLTRRKLVGVVLGFAGVVVVILERGLDASVTYLKGNLIIYVAVLAWGLYTVFGRDLIRRYGPIEASAVTLIVGTVAFLPVGGYVARDFPFGSLPEAAWWQILYLSLITSVAAYFLWYYALGRMEAGRVAVFANLQPILTTILAVVLLGQDITPAFLVGGSVAITGVAIAQYG